MTPLLPVSFYPSLSLLHPRTNSETFLKVELQTRDISEKLLTEHENNICDALVKLARLSLAMYEKFKKGDKATRYT